ncbi:hypothetical protein MA16_Dca028351 [Dendrobium catenatum]|uniref:Uncharacterized protein n=1 Tax=Dendrobium catenatum TaxID=906689 RepID=A0A2I0VFX0_9ASPA|nr:hypothetical protein MA16_Dca028351 [Dendrobium catenatum]
MRGEAVCSLLGSGFHAQELKSLTSFATLPPPSSLHQPDHLCCSQCPTPQSQIKLTGFPSTVQHFPLKPTSKPVLSLPVLAPPFPVPQAASAPHPSISQTPLNLTTREIHTCLFVPLNLTQERQKALGLPFFHIQQPLNQPSFSVVDKTPREPPLHSTFPAKTVSNSKRPQQQLLPTKPLSNQLAFPF